MAKKFHVVPVSLQASPAIIKNSSLTSHVLNSSSVNSFKNNLDSSWSNQEVYYNFIYDKRVN